MRRVLIPAVASVPILASLLVLSHHLVIAQGQAPGAPASGTATPGQLPGRGTAAPRVGTGKITGRVVAVETGIPLVRAQIRVAGLPNSPNEPPPVVLTDDQGHYEITKLPAGRFTITAAMRGYQTLAYGQRRAGEAGRPVELADAQSVDRVDFALPRGSAIVAHVADDFGEPIAGVRVQAERYRFVNGLRTLGSSNSGTTDDHGDAILSGVAPGDYYVSANASFFGRGATLDSTSSRRLYAQTYYPGTAIVSEARRVTVSTGQDVNIAFPLVVVHAARISGLIRASDGSVPKQATVSFTLPGFSSNVTVQPDGSFSIANVLPGEYTLSVRPPFQPTPGATQEYGHASVKVTGEDVSGLAITTNRGATIRGRLKFDTGAPPTDQRPGALQVYPAFTGTAISNGEQGVWQEDWTFVLRGLVGSAVLRIRSSAPTTSASTWFLKSVTLDGKDITDTPIELNGPDEIANVEVLLTQKRTEINGSVTDNRNTPVSDYLAVFFPESKDLWTPQSRFISTARPDQQGRFKVTGLPPGRYLAVAVDGLETGEERDPDLLARLQGAATRLTIAEGETKSVNLKMTTN